MKVLKVIFLGLSIILTPIGHGVPSSNTGSKTGPDKKQILEALKNAHKWLTSQQVPNSKVPKPTRKHFILSYDHSPKKAGHKYIFSKSSLYDNALAIIAFTMLGSYQQAYKIVEAFQKNSPTGHFYFNYNTHNNWPNTKDRFGAVTRNGASAWMGYAIAYYLKLRLLKDKKYKKSDEFKATLNYLSKVIEEILKFKISKKEDPRNGLILGGHGIYKLEISKKGKVEENFYDEPIPWVSIEHCMDLYFLLKEAIDLGLTQFKSDLKVFSEKLVPLFWNKKLNQFNRGYGVNDKDPVEALDAASWAAIYLYSIGDLEKALLALEKTEAYRNWQAKIKGHRPYHNVRIFEDYHINKHYYPKEPNKFWNNININWYEGTFGVLLAHLKVKGNTPKSSRWLTDLLKAQNSDGSFAYATKEIPFQFSDRPSVASTAWFIIAATSYLVPEIRQNFWP